MPLLACVLVAVLCRQPAAGQPAQGIASTASPTPEDGRYLPPNTWVRLETVPTQRSIATAITDCTRVGVLSHPVGRRASSIVYGGGIFYFGGDFGSNNGNDVELFDIASNTWTQQYQPECFPSCCFAGRCLDGVYVGRLCSSDTDCLGSICGEGQCYTGPNSGDLCVNDYGCANGSCLTFTCSGGPDAGGVCYYDQDCHGGSCSVCNPGCLGIGLTRMGRPYVEKTYQVIAYNPLRKKYTYTADLTPGLLEWDPSTREWTQLAKDRPESTDTATKMLVYDPDLQTVLYFATTQVNHTVFRFDYATNKWVAYSPIPEEISWNDIFSAYDSKEHKYLVSHGSGTMWIYDALAGTWTQLGNVPADIAFYSAVDMFSMAYDPIAGVCLLAKREPDSAHSVQLWSYRIVTDTWTRLEVAGDPPSGPTVDYNGLVYDDVWKRFYFLNVRSTGGGGEGGSGEADVETWAYRIGGPVGPGDANCDGRVTAADLAGLIQSGASNPGDGCGAVDTNRDGVVSEVDLSNTVDALFKVPQYTPMNTPTSTPTPTATSTGPTRTPTTTPTRTPTKPPTNAPTSTPTATAAIPSCPALPCTTSPCTFCISSNLDDISIESYGSSYPPPSNNASCTGGGSDLYAYRGNVSGAFYTDFILLRWTTQLPAGAVVSSAYMWWHPDAAASPEGRNLTCDWHAWTTCSGADYSTTVPTGDAIVADPVSNFQSGFLQKVPHSGSLLNLSNIVLHGETSIRCTIDGGEPGAGVVNRIPVLSYTASGDATPRLVVAFDIQTATSNATRQQRAQLQRGRSVNSRPPAQRQRVPAKVPRRPHRQAESAL